MLDNPTYEEKLHECRYSHMLNSKNYELVNEFTLK